MKIHQTSAPSGRVTKTTATTDLRREIEETTAADTADRVPERIGLALKGETTAASNDQVMARIVRPAHITIVPIRRIARMAKAATAAAMRSLNMDATNALSAGMSRAKMATVQIVDLKGEGTMTGLGISTATGPIRTGIGATTEAEATETVTADLHTSVTIKAETTGRDTSRATGRTKTATSETTAIAATEIATVGLHTSETTETGTTGQGTSKATVPIRTATSETIAAAATEIATAGLHTSEMIGTEVIGPIKTVIETTTAAADTADTTGRHTKETIEAETIARDLATTAKSGLAMSDETMTVHQETDETKSPATARIAPTKAGTSDSRKSRRAASTTTTRNRAASVSRSLKPNLERVPLQPASMEN